MSTGNRYIQLYFNIYPKKLGILTPSFSAIDFIIKFGPFPIYVKHPNYTDVTHIIFKNSIEFGYKPLENASTSFGFAILAPSSDIINANEFMYVGVLSKNEDKNAIIQKNTPGDIRSLVIVDDISSIIVKAGPIVIKIPKNRNDSSTTGSKENSFFFNISLSVNLYAVIPTIINIISFKNAIL